MTDARRGSAMLDGDAGFAARSFLRSGQTPEQSGLASAVVALGQTLALEVVAEGIELKEQWNTLRDLGCESGQGFYFARPMEGSDAMQFLGDAIEAQGKSPEHSPVAAPTDRSATGRRHPATSGHSVA